MIKFTDKKSLWYDDVVLIAQPGVVESRQEIPIEGYRIVTSAMTSIVCPEFLKAVSKLAPNLQPTIHIPRDQFAEEHIKLAATLGLKHIFVGIGLNTLHLEEIALQAGYKTLLIDVANGGIPQLPNKIKELKDEGFTVIAGSVHDRTVAYNLQIAGATILRTGVGTGGVCITKDKTGFTRGNITEILELQEYTEYKYPVNAITWREKKVSLILADGGFKNSGDVCKAFLAGADYIMSGRLFVDAEESRLRVDGTNLYYGMASLNGKKDFGNKQFFIEGKTELMSKDNVRPLETILTELWDGIRSAVSYSGYKTLSEAIGNGVFEVKGR